jgi:acid phosphatase
MKFNWIAALGGAFVALSTVSVQAQTPVPQDWLEANLWMQSSVEFKANARTVYALGRLRLDQALADRKWTAAPAEQTGDYENLPPAVVLDIDETTLDNSLYQVWAMKTGNAFSLATWNQFCNDKVSRAVPGSAEFTRYAESKGVKVFYISNRGVEVEQATRDNMEKFGFAMGGNVDTFLMQGEKPDWGSKKGTRRAAIVKDYRILLEFGDNFGDFDDRYASSGADRQKFFEENRERWGREWLMIANASYGSFDGAPFRFNYKAPADEQRKAKWDVLEAWAGPSKQ